MSLEFDFSIDKGSFKLKLADCLTSKVTGVFGPSGSGKTTLLHLIAGIEKPDEGYLRWRGTPLVDMAENHWVPPYRRGMAIVFQEARLFPHMNVEANLKYGEAHLPHDARRFPLEEVVELLSIEHLLTQMPGVLSGGESQRIALGRALMSSPRLLLLDEPFASLDQNLKRQILPYLTRIKEAMGIPMVFVSHDLEPMLQLADDMMILHQGRSLGKGSFLDLVQRQETAEILDAQGILNVISAEVKESPKDNGMMVLQLKRAGRPALAAPDWIAPAWVLPPRCQLQIGLRPEDIALATEPAPQVTIQNQIPGVVDRILEEGPRIRCFVDVGVQLLVEITANSAKALNLKPGKPVYVFFKAQALQKLSMH